MSHLLAPSILSANFGQLASEIEMINNSKADWFHIDIMDGLFVPNITFGAPVMKVLQKLAKKPLDVHLMIVEPERYLEYFRDLGAQILTIHYEASIHLHRSVNEIKRLGMKAGVVLNPHTPVHLLSDIISDLDLVLIMSVNPGFGGQNFIDHSLNKIRELKELIEKKSLHTIIEVDGGITLENAPKILKAGTDVLVAGATVFNSANPTETITKLKAI